MKSQFVRLLLPLPLMLPLVIGSAVAQETAPKPAVVAVAAEVRNLEQSVVFNGRMDANRRIALIARVGGFLEKVEFKPGATVEAGQRLFLIEPALYQDAVKQAEGALRSAEAQRELARIDRDRQKELVTRETASQARLDQANANFSSAEGDAMRAEAALSQARTNLSYTEIKAPFAGRIGDNAVDEGALVGPEVGPLVTLVELDPIHVEFPVPTAELQDFLDQVKGGTASDIAAVTLVLANGAVYDSPGDIDFLDSRVNPQTDSVTLRARFANPDGRLLDQELVRVKLSAAQMKGELTIPEQAIQRDVQGAFVLVIGAGDVVEQRRVTTGRSAQGFAVISSGLEAGERVITEGANKVRPGVAVDAAAPGG